MEKSFYVIQERSVGRFSVLTYKGFQPRGNGVASLEFSEEIAGSLARTFTVESGRKCWIEEVQYFTVSRVVTWGPEPIETLNSKGDFEVLTDKTNAMKFTVQEAEALVKVGMENSKPNIYEYYYSAIL
jgi:hypothetical protein